MAEDADSDEILTLRSPCGAEALTFTWPLPVVVSNNKCLEKLQCPRYRQACAFKRLFLRLLDVPSTLF